MIEINDLQFYYQPGDFQLKIPHLIIPKGAKVVIVGASGCGKTTLLHLIAGIKVCSQGCINIDSVNLSQLNEQSRRQFRITNIGLIFQNFELIDYLNVFDNILHCYRLNPALSLTKEVKDNAYHLAEKVGIVGKLKRSINNLSQGERQRVAICRALLTQPKLLLADEATGNLDPANKQRIMQILFSYLEEYEATLIAVTHDYELLNLFDQVIDLKQFSLEENVK
ncbi:MAG: ATP-binding cassette domain-containing protein [Crocosphaera sp.]|nr:ATP-binding cassette domain-containing protein [Crocosphaera sp.]